MSRDPWHFPKHATEGADRFRAPKGPIWKDGDPAATWMVQFLCGHQTINQLGYTANPSNDDLVDYAKYHHVLTIEVRRYVGYPIYWKVDRTLRIEQTDWL